MVKNLHTHLVIVICATFLVVEGLSKSLGDEPPKPRNAEETSITELLQKRRAILSQLVTVATEAYRRGEVSIASVFQAHQDLLRADLELATSDNERIKLLEKSVELLDEFQKIAEAKYKAGQASQVDVLKSQAETLRVKIDLLRLRQRANKKKGN